MDGIKFAKPIQKGLLTAEYFRGNFKIIVFPLFLIKMFDVEKGWMHVCRVLSVILLRGDWIGAEWISLPWNLRKREGLTKRAGDFKLIMGGWR